MMLKAAASARGNGGFAHFGLIVDKSQLLVTLYTNRRFLMLGIFTRQYRFEVTNVIR